MKKIILFPLTVLLSLSVFSQTSDRLNAITTAIPILNITPNAGERAMAEIGVVASEYNYEAGLFQNPALLSRNKKVFGVKISHMPWIRNFGTGESISDVGIYYSINEKNIIASNFYYFNTKSISSGIYRTAGIYEFFGSIKYAHSFTEHFSTGISLKYIISNLANSPTLQSTRKLTTYAGDIGFDYRNEFGLQENKKIKYDLGLSVTDLGPKVLYYQTSIYKDFIPTNLKLGTMWTFEKLLPEEKQINYTLAYQAEKMLVPTPPYYENGVMLGVDDEVSAIEGIFQSFYDAPFGFKEEIHEILHKFGGEIMYQPKEDVSLALRAGYFSEHYTKGNRKFGTAGIGLKYKFLYLDLAYIIISRQSVYANTININLGFQKMLD